MKSILITGINSYVGNHIKIHLLKDHNRFIVETISLKNNLWRENDFSKYDVIIHVAALVHEKEKKKAKDNYFRVNSDLTKEIAIKAKNSGIGYFIFISTFSVYGLESKLNEMVTINESTIENPNTFYGLSKLQAEIELKDLVASNFKLLILRLPMIYGDNCPGNYSKLEKFATLSPFFPSIFNQRSVLHINKLARSILEYINLEKEGLIVIQDNKYSSTSEMVKEIAISKGKNIYMSKLLGKLILIFGKRSKTITKAFGNLVYNDNKLEQEK